MEVRVNRIGRNSRGKGTGGEIGGGGGPPPPAPGSSGNITTIRAEQISPILGSGEYVEVVCSEAHGLTTGGILVTIAGNSVAGYNGEAIIAVVKSTTVFAIEVTYTADGTGGTWSVGTVNLLTGLVAYYRLNSDLTDSRGDNDLTGTGDTYAAGKMSNGLIDGNGVHSTWTALTDNRPCSLCCWFKPNAAGTNAVEFNHAGGSLRFGLILDGAGTLGYRIGTGIASVTTVTPGSFYHVAMTIGAGGGWTYYVDGAVVGTGGVSARTLTTFRIIAVTTSMIDEVAIYDREVPQSVISGLYNGGSGRDPTA